MRDLASPSPLQRLIVERVATRSPEPVIIDLGTVDNNHYLGVTLAMFVGVGGIEFTSANYIALKLEDGDDGVSFDNVTPGETLLGPNTGALGSQPPDTDGLVRLIANAKVSEDTAPFKVTYVGNNRYLRVTIIFGGMHTAGTDVVLWAALGYPSSVPEG